MKNQEGFIQVPILIVIIAGILVLGSTSYVAVKQYKNSQNDKIEKAKQAQEQLDIQQKALQSTQAESEKIKSAELEALRKEVDELKQQTKTNQISIQKSQRAPQLSQEITATDIQSYLDTVGVIMCFDANNNTQYGTGVLLKIGKLMTNWHVVEGMSACLFVNEKFLNSKYELSAERYRPGAYVLDLLNIQRPNEKRDFAIVSFDRNKKINAQASGIPADEYLEVYQLNYKVGSMPRCSENVQIGTPVAILGYPASSINIEQWMPPESVTTGIISGYNPPHYLVSAKVDHGNSGGLALGKESGVICLLGMPTWVAVGQVESAGIVQNIRNLID